MSTTLDEQNGCKFFIPSNTAISALGGNQSISDVGIKNHVIQGFSAYSSRLKQCQTLTTVNGGVLTVTKTRSGDIFIEGAKTISNEIFLENEVAYVIDRVSRRFDSLGWT